jgi:hypothetical protein
MMMPRTSEDKHVALNKNAGDGVGLLALAGQHIHFPLKFPK